MSKRIQFTVSGVVQGVNFRYFTAKRAMSLGMTGYVQNEANGTVTGQVQGDDDGLKSFLEVIKKGPPLATVTGVQTKDVDAKEGEKTFIQYR